MIFGHLTLLACAGLIDGWWLKVHGHFLLFYWSKCITIIMFSCLTRNTIVYSVTTFIYFYNLYSPRPLGYSSLGSDCIYLWLQAYIQTVYEQSWSSTSFLLANISYISLSFAIHVCQFFYLSLSPHLIWGQPLLSNDIDLLRVWFCQNYQKNWLLAKVVMSCLLYDICNMCLRILMRSSRLPNRKS